MQNECTSERARDQKYGKDSRTDHGHRRMTRNTEKTQELTIDIEESPETGQQQKKAQVKLTRRTRDEEQNN